MSLKKYNKFVISNIPEKEYLNIKDEDFLHWLMSITSLPFLLIRKGQEEVKYSIYRNGWVDKAG